MARCYVTDADGVTYLDPDGAQQRDILREFFDDPAAIGDIWLVNTASGWGLNVFPSGLIQLERPGHPLCEAGPVTFSDVFQLWQQLGKGEIERIRSLPWRQPAAGE